MTKSLRKPARTDPAAARDTTTGAGTRQRALIAALALFDAQGVDATTIEQVRDAADISIGSLYHHFRSREGLVGALYEDLLERYRAVLAAELARHDTTRALLDAFVATHIDWSVRNPAAARFLAEHRHHPALKAAESRLQHGTTDFLHPLLLRLRPAMTAGILRPLPPELLLSLVIGPVQTWLRMQRAGHTSLKPAGAAQKLSDLIWDAIAVPVAIRKAAARTAK